MHDFNKIAADMRKAHETKTPFVLPMMRSSDLSVLLSLLDCI